MKSDYYFRVPKEIHANLAFRKGVIKAGYASRHHAKELWQMCSQDMLFWINTMLFVYEPRDKHVLPFLTYGFQDEALIDIHNSIGNNDIVVEKSRDMGASWCCITAMLWHWQFTDYFSGLLVSRKESFVDATGDPKSLFWKIDFLLNNQPKFMLPQFDRQRMKLLNLDNKSTMDGESTTGDTAAGDRRTCIMLDEFARVEDGNAVLASTRDATRCRIFNSTPQGAQGAFYSIVQEASRSDAVIKKVTLHWSRHPEKNKGMWTDPEKKGRFKFRSPWYDEQCRRAVHPVEIAQELDIDYGGSDYGFFDGGQLDRYVQAYARDPLILGTLNWSRETLAPEKFMVAENGEWKLWAFLTGDGQLQDQSMSCVVACDIASGSGGKMSSQSTLVVYNRETREKVAEFASATIDPKEFGRMAVAACKFFGGRDTVHGGAFLIWDDTGFGATFRSSVLEAGYGRIYMRKSEGLRSKPTDKPGFFFTPSARNQLLSNYRDAIKNEKIVNRSSVAIAECREFVYITAAREVQHSKAVRAMNPAESGANHGDLVIADALAWLLMSDDGSSTVPQPAEPSIPVGCLAWRRMQYEQQLSGASAWSRGGHIKAGVRW